MIAAAQKVGLGRPGMEPVAREVGLGLIVIEVEARFDERGWLAPMYLHDLPFRPVRWAFIASARDRQVRGNHAHKKTQQLLYCVRGVVTVEAWTQSGRTVTVKLPAHERALYVPPMVWARQTYHGSGDMLWLSASLPYSESDYIRDSAAFFDAGRAPKEIPNQADGQGR